jgi:hypothetical protein
MTRETLPNRRFTAGHSFVHDGQEYMGHVGYYDDGRIAELFLTGAKVGTAVDTGARESSTVASFALQYGAPVDKIRSAMPRDPAGRALGPVGAFLDLLHGEAA